MSSREIRVGPNDWDAVIRDASGYQIVVAGPGTGKTEFLVKRVEHIVRTGQARRDQIAVVCFSRRAAGEIRNRIETTVGGTGTPIDATTFHSLALRLLEAADPGQRPIPLTTPEQVGFVSEVLRDEDPENWPITYRGILTTQAFAAEIADFLMRCSERLLTPHDLEKRVRARADWRGIPQLFGRYTDLLSERGRTDYGVLLTSAVDLLTGDEGRSLASGYRFVLVDEYQDTSPAQAEIARLLAKPSGNLTVTGDPYQSIYSFRGAELRNLAEYQREHPDATRIVLTPSLRVPTEIMESALRVVSPGHLPGESGPVEPAAHSGSVEAYLFDQETAEAEWIAREIERTVLVDGIQPRSIAVLVRTKKELVTELSRSLARRGVPHDPPDRRLVDHPAVRLLHDLVTVAVSGGALPVTSASASAEADRSMRRILLGPLVGLSLAQERDLLRRRRRTWAPWAAVLDEYLDGHSDLAILLRDADWATDGPAIDGFWQLWSGVAGLKRLVEDPDRSLWRKAWTSFAQVLDRQAERDTSVTLARFFELVEDGDYEATPLLSYAPGAAGVTLTTLHQAKGLEFDVVFIANAVEGVFPDLRRSRRMLRPELLSPERTSDPRAQHLFQLQEEMRLAYTAMTRARLRVVWTATDAGIDQGEHRPSRFLAAAAGVSSIDDLGPPIPEPGDPVTLGGAEIMLRRSLGDPEADDVVRLVAAATLADPETDWWDPTSFAGVPVAGPDSPIIGGNLRLSPSQADAYDTCPRRYALERRLRLGNAASPWAQFGSLVHAALERAEAPVVGTGSQHASLEQALEAIERVWADADFGTAALNAAWKAEAVGCITKLYENWPHPDGEPIALEQTVERVIGDVPWMGRLDRLERTPDGLRVVDYKTSKTPTPVKEAESSIQLAFYAAAVEGAGQVAAAEMWFPRAGTKQVTTRELDLEARADVEASMEAITRSVLSEDWHAKPGRHCERCDFRRSCPAWPEGRGAYLP